MALPKQKIQNQKIHWKQHL